jgi:hypothetical protein
MYNKTQAAEKLGLNPKQFDYQVYVKHHIKPDQVVKGVNLYSQKTLNNLRSLIEADKNKKAAKKAALKQSHIQSIKQAAEWGNWNYMPLSQLTYIVSKLKHYGVIVID